MSDFQVFIDYSFPWFMAGLLIRVACWVIGCSVGMIEKGVGDDDI